MRYVKYKAADGSVIRGEVLQEAGKEVRVLDMDAKAGSRALFWLPASSCVPITVAEVSRFQSAESEGGKSASGQAALATAQDHRS